MKPQLKIFENQNVLITGGGGYLGSKLAEELTKSKANIILLDISFNDISKILDSSNDNIELLNVDLLDKNCLYQICKKIQPDYIFHFAAILNRNRDFEIYDKLYSVNVKGTLNLLDSLKHVDYKGFFFASTSEIYGNKNTLPFQEEQLPEPASPYSLTKFMAESLIKSYSCLNSKPVTIFRFFNFFGPDMADETFIGQMLNCYRENKIFKMTQGKQKRDFIYIDDLIDQILFVINNNDASYDLYNICSNNLISMIEVANIFRELTDGRFVFDTCLNYRPNEIWEMCGSNERLLKLNYKPANTSFYLNLGKLIES